MFKLTICRIISVEVHGKNLGLTITNLLLLSWMIWGKLINFSEFNSSEKIIYSLELKKQKSEARVHEDKLMAP